jgi:hypothetical protein
MVVAFSNYHHERAKVQRGRFVVSTKVGRVVIRSVNKA